MIFNRVSTQDKALFASHLSVMLKSGIPIDEALRTLVTQTASKRLQAAINHVSLEVEKGTMLSSAFMSEEKVFGSIFVNLIKAGEESGTLRENLLFLADWFEHSADLEREVNSALLYPKLVVSATVLLGGSLALFILPRLIPMFTQLDVELPLVTKVLLAITVFVQSYWLWCLIAIGAMYAAMRVFLRIPGIRTHVDRAVLSVPFIGSILVEYQLALITQLFATLLKSGMPITGAVSIVKDATPNRAYRGSIEIIEEHIVTGKVVSGAMEMHPELYPPVSVSIVAIGEQSGTLSDSFASLSLFFTKEVKTKTKRLPTIVEPLLLVFIALAVGLVALAIILPIYKLTGSVNR